MKSLLFVMRSPIAVTMMVVALVSSGALALTRMQVDIVPSLRRLSPPRRRADAMRIQFRLEN
jgi:hypothetical protein